MITQSIYPFWFAGFLAYLAFVFTALHPFWPSKIKIRFGSPIDLQDLTAAIDTEDERLKAAYDRVCEKIQEGMDSLHKR